MASLLGRFAIFVGYKDLRGLDLSGLDLRKANLRNCDLTGARLDGCNLRGVHAEGANFTGASFVRTDLSGGHFNDTDFERAKFTECRWAGASFVYADMRGLKLAGEDLQGANFASANLSDAELRDTLTRNANFQGATAWNLDLRNSDARGSDWTGAILDGAKCDNADLSRATLTETALIEASLCNVKLWDTQLNRTKLGGADLQNVKVDLTQLEPRQRSRFRQFAWEQAKRDVAKEASQQQAKSWRPERVETLDTVLEQAIADVRSKFPPHKSEDLHEQHNPAPGQQPKPRATSNRIPALDSLMDAVSSAWETASQQVAAEDALKATTQNRDIEPKSATNSRAQNLDPTRLYLDVPYAEKDLVKELGASWDRHEARWFVPQDNVPEELETWLPQPQKQTAPSQVSPQQVADKQQTQSASKSGDSAPKAAVEFARAHRAKRPRHTIQHVDTVPDASHQASKREHSNGHSRSR